MIGESREGPVEQLQKKNLFHLYQTKNIAKYFAWCFT